MCPWYLPGRQDGNLKHSHNTAALNTSPPPFTDFKSYTGVSSKKIRKFKRVIFFKFRGIYYSNEKQPMCVCFCLETGYISSSIQVPKWVSHV